MMLTKYTRMGLYVVPRDVMEHNKIKYDNQCISIEVQKRVK